MQGTDKGFVGQLRANNINSLVLHCLIHQQSLCGNTIKDTDALKTMIKITNLLRGGHHSLTHRQLKPSLSEIETEYNNLLLVATSRWLSAGTCLQRFFLLRNNILTFLKNSEVKTDTSDFQKN